MTLLDLLVKGSGVPADKLRELFAAGANAEPDLAPIAEAATAKLNEELTSEKLVALGKVLFSQGLDILHGNIVSRDHPSDA